jgi:hypothetical protein
VDVGVVLDGDGDGDGTNFGSRDGTVARGRAWRAPFVAVAVAVNDHDNDDDIWSRDGKGTGGTPEDVPPV